MPKSLRTPAQRALQKILAEKRASLGLTQAQVAARLERPQSFVAKYENGERKLDLIEFCAIARALRIEPMFLFREFLEAANL
ncbi:MAG TPA: helix-turn-helix transcriptional regulator [Sphingomonas sp.]|jgi:transcriptional regulator with XRE-family HTH domain|nr:helix-turn-helix transcriptional regulator [Sphingomonas sp.]